MIEIDGKIYMIDIDNLMSWVSETPNSEKNIITTTTMTYPISNDDDEEMVEKEVSENKTSLNDVMNNIRYDLIKNLFNVLFTTYTNDINQIINGRINDLTFSQKLVFNTLIHKRIIIEISKNSNE